MGNRICIRITDGENTTPTLYCHWMGLEALAMMVSALEGSRKDIRNLMCNLIVKTMNGECWDRSYYIYNDGEAEGIADWDWCTWTFDIRDETWTTTFPCLRGRRMTMIEVSNMAYSGIPGDEERRSVNRCCSSPGR